MTNVDTNSTNPDLFDLSENEIEAVSGGVIPIGPTVGLRLASYVLNRWFR